MLIHILKDKEDVAVKANFLIANKWQKEACMMTPNLCSFLFPVLLILKNNSSLIYNNHL